MSGKAAPSTNQHLVDMSAFARLVWKSVCCVIVGLVITLGPLYLLLAMVGLAWTPDTCITESPSGDFIKDYRVF